MSIAAALERNFREHIEQGLPIVSDLMVEDTRAACSRRSGELADSIEMDPWSNDGTRYSSTIRATSDHARYQDEGTGIYGPEGTRIEAPPGGVLAFDWPAAGGVVYFKSVAGSPGTHFFMEPMPDRFAAAARAAFG